MVSCRVFHPSAIESFRRHGIRDIFTLRMSDEVEEEWDIEANKIIDGDEFFKRRWIDVGDHPTVDLLKHLPILLETINNIILDGKKVYVHWYKSYLYETYGSVKWDVVDLPLSS
jgi:hypothetical protein